MARNASSKTGTDWPVVLDIKLLGFACTVYTRKYSLIKAAGVVVRRNNSRSDWIPKKAVVREPGDRLAVSSRVQVKWERKAMLWHAVVVRSPDDSSAEPLPAAAKAKRKPELPPKGVALHSVFMQSA